MDFPSSGPASKFPNATIPRLPHFNLILTPGLSHVVKTILPKIVTPPALILAAEAIVEYAGHGDLVPAQLKTAVGLIALSLGVTITFALLKGIWRRVKQRQEMWRMGAKPVSVAKGRWPGNLDLLLELLRMIREDYVAQFPQDMAIKYGNRYNLKFLGVDRIVTDNPKDIKQILVTDFSNWDKGEDFRDATHLVLGTGVFGSDGDTWKFHRGMTRPFFSRERITDFEIFGRHSSHAIELIKQRCEAGQAIDLQDLAGRFTMDSATEFLFGVSVNSMNSPLPLPKTTTTDTDSENSFVVAFQSALMQTAFRIVKGPYWAFAELTKDQTRQDMDDINAYLMPMVDKALEKKRSGEKLEEKEEGEMTLLRHLAASTEDREIVRDELLNILIAGRDTTSHAITAIFYFLSTQNPDFLQNVREEIISTLGQETPTFETIKGMKYLRAVINETLRLLPSVPLNSRNSREASVWTDEDGTRWYIPENTNAIVNTIGMHRRKDLWGPDADDFDPERWLDDRNRKYYLANPFIYLPFHAGPRICLGQQFAINETSFFVIRILQAFDSIDFVEEAFPEGTLPPKEWKESYGRRAMEKVRPRSHLTTYIDGGLWLRLRDTKKA